MIFFLLLTEMDLRRNKKKKKTQTKKQKQKQNPGYLSFNPVMMADTTPLTNVHKKM